jgi:nicotinamide mononucleotide adenylyltransferase
MELLHNKRCLSFSSSPRSGTLANHSRNHDNKPRSLNPATMGGLPADSFASSVPRTAVHPTGTPTPPPEAMSEPYHGYSFPHDRLKRRLTRANKTPLVLVSCGSFSPPTSLHMSMFSVAESYVDHTGYELVGSYMSPCSDTYGKSSLVPAHHRINM